MHQFSLTYQSQLIYCRRVRPGKWEDSPMTNATMPEPFGSEPMATIRSIDSARIQREVIDWLAHRVKWEQRLAQLHAELRGGPASDVQSERR